MPTIKVARRRVLLGAPALAATALIPRAALAQGIEMTRVIAAPGEPRILVYPGHDHASWGFPDMKEVLRRHGNCGHYEYDLSRRWDSERPILQEHLRSHLERGPVVLVGYSKGACAALDIIAECDPPPDLLARLSVVLAAPAALVRRPWRYFAPTEEWSQRWQRGQRFLFRQLANRRMGWCSFFEAGIRLLYSSDDRIVHPDGVQDLAERLPRKHVFAPPMLKRHLMWRKKEKRLQEFVLDALLDASSRKCVEVAPVLEM